MLIARAAEGRGSADKLMINLPQTPAGSTIEVRHEVNRSVLSWKNASGGLGRYATILFLIFWMGGWVIGEKSALTSVFKGEGGAFLIFWLAGWTVGGVFCAITIFNLARPSRPERISLDTLNLLYEPGTPTRASLWKQERNWNPLEMLRPKRSYKVGKKEIGEIRIDRVGERQRLSFDYGAKRIEVGENLEEPEREWLLTVLNSWKSA